MYLICSDEMNEWRVQRPSFQTQTCREGPEDGVWMEVQSGSTSGPRVCVLPDTKGRGSIPERITLTEHFLYTTACYCCLDAPKYHQNMWLILKNTVLSIKNPSIIYLKHENIYKCKLRQFQWIITSHCLHCTYFCYFAFFVNITWNV